MSLSLVRRAANKHVVFSIYGINNIHHSVSNTILGRVGQILGSLSRGFLPVLGIFVSSSAIRDHLGNIKGLAVRRTLRLNYVNPVTETSNVLASVHTTRGSDICKRLRFRPIVRASKSYCTQTEMQLERILQSIRVVRNYVSGVPSKPVSIGIQNIPPGERYFIHIRRPEKRTLCCMGKGKAGFLRQFHLEAPAGTGLPTLMGVLRNYSLTSIPGVVLAVSPYVDYYRE